MLSNLMQRVRDFFSPYSFEDYVADNKPQTREDYQELERTWLQQVGANSWPKF